MRINFGLRKLCLNAIFAAISVILVMLIHFPLIPAAPFLEYDPGDAVIMAGTFLFGPLSGLLLTFVTCLIQGLTVSAQSGVYGILMHFISTSVFVVIAGGLYRFRPKMSASVFALAAGTFAAILVMIPLNLLITPLFMGTPREAVYAMLWTVIVPFNAIKFSLNAVIAFALWVPIRMIYRKLWGEMDVY